jgi:processive 1,2-diacylglycerol beta-glucosyltransferase
MSEPSRILVLSVSAGTGHTIAADAIEHELRAQAPRAAIEVVDVLTLTSSAFRKGYGGGYLWLVRHFPDVMGWLYDAMETPGVRDSLREKSRAWLQHHMVRPVRRFLERKQPHLIVNTHYLSTEIVARLRNDRRLSSPQVTVTTDYETHRIWAHQPCERYYTATQLGSFYLTTWGVPPQNTLVTGIPLRPGFTSPLTPAQARQRCQLDPHTPVVLLLCGGLGVGPVAERFRELLRMPAEAQVVAITGRNEKLRRRLSAIAADSGRNARVIGYTDQMHEWMRAADLAVSKTGGLTVAECMVCELPMVVMDPVPGQETRNCDHLLEQGAAVKVNHIRLLGYRVARLLQDNRRLLHMRASARAAARPDAARKIVADALRFIRKPVV